MVEIEMVARSGIFIVTQMCRGGVIKSHKKLKYARKPNKIVQRKNSSSKTIINLITQGPHERTKLFHQN